MLATSHVVILVTVCCLSIDFVMFFGFNLSFCQISSFFVNFPIIFMQRKSLL